MKIFIQIDQKTKLFKVLSFNYDTSNRVISLSIFKNLSNASNYILEIEKGVQREKYCNIKNFGNCKYISCHKNLPETEMKKYLKRLFIKKKQNMIYDFIKNITDIFFPICFLTENINVKNSLDFEFKLGDFLFMNDKCKSALFIKEIENKYFNKISHQGKLKLHEFLYYPSTCIKEITLRHSIVQQLSECTHLDKLIQLIPSHKTNFSIKAEEEEDDDDDEKYLFLMAIRKYLNQACTKLLNFLKLKLSSSDLIRDKYLEEMCEISGNICSFNFWLDKLKYCMIIQILK